MSNRLSGSNSPYLLQHADNPVNWYPWSGEALEKAKREDKPIFLSIGYAACHWCHVMAHESFENAEIAALMNEHFINIKVDREERPDLDNIYMNAVVALTGHGGWPMSVFLTPDGEPFYGGTYYPPVPRYGMPSFREVLIGIARAWKEDREKLIQSGQQLSQQLSRTIVMHEKEQPLQADTLEKAAMGLAQTYDWQHGGWGKAPKFPQPMAIEFLLRLAARGDQLALDIATHALSAMAKGGMYDVIGGGFSRYSVDDRWLVPHFEKMLYDNALLSRVYLYAYLLTGNETFNRVCTETLDFVARELTHPEGGFFSSLDADSEGEEGKFYVWTPAEIRTALDDPGDAEFISAAYNITETGNFDGKNVLQREMDDASLAEQFGLTIEKVQTRLDRLHSRLLQARAQRVRPGTDDKVLVSWNGLMLLAFSEAARYLDRPDYLGMAIRNARFLIAQLHPNDRLLRSWRNGRAEHNAYLEDYAAFALALLSLYQSDPNPHWYTSAVRLTEDMLSHFLDPQGGFFDTRDDHQPLVTRPKEVQDNAIPSGNALAATVLLYLAGYNGKSEWYDLAEAMLSAIQNPAIQYPTAFSQWLCAIDLTLTPLKEVAVIGDLDHPLTRQLAATIWSTYRPHLIVAISPFPPSSQAPALLAERTLLENQPTAYVCHNFVCLQPVTQPLDLQAQLKNG